MSEVTAKSSLSKVSGKKNSSYGTSPDISPTSQPEETRMEIAESSSTSSSSSSDVKEWGKSSYQQQKNPLQSASSSSSSTSDTEQQPRYTTVEEEVEMIGFGRFHIIALVILGIANASDAIELLAMSFILPQLSDGEFTDNVKAFLSAAIFIGMLVGGLVFGVASDVYGRRKCLATALAINAIFGILSALIPTEPYLGIVACRVLGGFGVGGSIPGVFTIAAEILPVKGRGFWLSFVAWWWMIGSIYAAGAAWVIIGTFGASWRIFAMICAIPAGVASLLILLLVPETARYLHLSGDVSGAEKVLMRIAAWNKTDCRLSKGYRLANDEDVESSSGKRRRRREGDEDDTNLEEETGTRVSANFKDVEEDIESQTELTKTQKAKVSSSTSSGGKHETTSFEIGNDEDDETLQNPLQKTPGGTTAAGDGIEEDSSLITSNAGKGSSNSHISNITELQTKKKATQKQQQQQQEPRAQPKLSFFSIVFCGCRSSSPSKRRARSELCAQLRKPFKDFFNPSIRRTSILLLIIWFCLSLGWYGLTLWIPTIFHETNVQLDEFQDAFLVQAANLPGNILSAFLMDRIGRKAVLTWSLVGAGIAAISFPFATVEVTVVLCACLLNATSTCTWNALDCLSTESFPTSLRTTAIGLLAASGRLGSIAGQFIFGALIHVSLFALLGVAGGVLVLGAIAGILLPKEPKGKQLSETV